MSPTLMHRKGSQVVTPYLAKMQQKMSPQLMVRHRLAQMTRTELESHLPLKSTLQMNLTEGFAAKETSTVLATGVLRKRPAQSLMLTRSLYGESILVKQASRWRVLVSLDQPRIGPMLAVLTRAAIFQKATGTKKL